MCIISHIYRFGSHFGQCPTVLGFGAGGASGSGDTTGVRVGHVNGVAFGGKH